MPLSALIANNNNIGAPRWGLIAPVEIERIDFFGSAACLERRGVVTRRAEARQYHYRAAVSEQEVQHSMVGELTERLFDGDVTALVQHLLSGEDISPGDLAKIRNMIERVDTNASESK